MTAQAEPSSPQPFKLIATPSDSGFFGLTELQRFTQGTIEPYSDSRPDEPLVLDFSLVKIWDIAALLWLVVALQHYRQRQGMPFLLKLPEGDPKGINTNGESTAFDRSADYLRRWRFDNALSNLSTDPSSLLVANQREFFANGEPRRFYLERAVTDEGGVLQSLISRRLVHIRNLSNTEYAGSPQVSIERITECIAAFQSARIGDILFAQCGVPKRDADLFADHLVTEALQNVREHPDATIGMIAISIMGRSRELILTVADNGKSIPHTIYRSYRDNCDKGCPPDYRREETPLETRAAIANYATKPGVSRKTLADAGDRVGMGLTYIKEDTVGTFGGKLRILTDGALLTFDSEHLTVPLQEAWEHPWQGNLLRISIPLARPGTSP